jgi:hypothetical protein
MIGKSQRVQIFWDGGCTRSSSALHKFTHEPLLGPGASCGGSSSASEPVGRGRARHGQGDPRGNFLYIFNLSRFCKNIWSGTNLIHLAPCPTT